MLRRCPAVVGLAVAAITSAAPPGRSGEVLRHIVIHKDDTKYEAWPDIERLANGDIVCAFYQAIRRDFITHLDTTGRCVLVRSSDEGRTWTPEPTVIYDDEDGQNSLGVAQLPDGRVMASFFTWRYLTEEQRQAITQPQDWSSTLIAGYPWAYILGAGVVASADGGRTWDRTYVPVGAPGWLGTATNKPVLELPGRKLLIPVYARRDQGDAYSSLVMRSVDGGRTWGRPVVVADRAADNISFGFNETSLVWLPNRTILAVMRTQGAGGYLYQARSTNLGLTWSRPELTPMVGQPADVLLLRNDSLVCTYGYRSEPYGIRACISKDFGRTWDIEHEVIVRHDGLGGDLGYPSSVELQDGTVLTVYYFYGEDGVRHIAGTFWRP